MVFYYSVVLVNAERPSEAFKNYSPLGCQAINNYCCRSFVASNKYNMI